MPCYSPLKGYKDSSGGLVFKSAGSLSTMQVACGQCIGCRIDRTRHWALRCIHEASLHELSCVVTLTYDDANLPEGGTLVKKHVQDFIKRLRKPLPPRALSYFYCGEYGENLLRPHYHAILFGIDFADKKPWKAAKDGSQLYISENLAKTWGKGHCSIGAVTPTSAAYVAGYILKKVTGDRAKDHYRGLLPEFINMSTRPAIGAGWLGKYGDETYISDSVIFRARPTKPPRFYDKKLRRKDPKTYERIKAERRDNRLNTIFKEGDLRPINNATPNRLKVREHIARAKSNLYKRDLS